MSKKLRQAHFQFFLTIFFFLLKKLHIVHSFGPNWVYNMNKGLWAWPNGFSNGLIQKVGSHEILLAMAQTLQV
jgi:hypothetical protein